ncbi:MULTISPECIES: PD40 domain-containing protein [Sorangium]|uniref:Uncharacterized protein n=1 Tax=Sorangium cellulosum TaxID=56 RepID=A0A4P2R539_SORCE|nr:MULTISPECIES: PD40 domain-containing protein [Sorangium]AUX38227.1 hypothetical protein SOCE836_104670 [Sorangium cellulosum]WCQ97515.1 hypothetical protein NQZ70_10309 [Sorangium sp. Soce836]
MRTLQHRIETRFVGVGAAFIGAAFVVACSSGPGGSPQQGQGTGGAGGAPDEFGAGTGNIFDVGSGGPVEPPPCEVCEDFPAAPVLDDAGTPPPANAPELFGAPGSGAPGGPCLAEPEIGALFPNNWLRPRFRWTAPEGQDLFEIRVHADREKNDLVVYTTNREWKMPKDMWEKLASHVRNEPITLTIRSVSTSAPGAPLLGTSGPITIAPAPAGGSMVYWAAIGEGPADAWLAGFGVGEEGVVDALKVEQVRQGGRRTENGGLRNDGAVRCIGCHTSTPDGESVIFTDHWPWGLAIASVQKDSVGEVPSYVTPGGSEAMSQAWLGAPRMSPAHFSPGDRIVVTSYGRDRGTVWDGQSYSAMPNARLAWFDLESPVPTYPLDANPNLVKEEMAAAEGTAYGFIAREGDTRGALMPDWSHDGDTIVYVSTDAGKDGRIGAGAGDLYTVPYNDRQGGAATPLEGAAEPAFNEYYPAFSPDDRLIAFNRTPSPGEMYYNPASDIYVIPAAGGAATRLAANDPPACVGVTSPGIHNSWPRWSPEATTVDGKTYYWVIFSSSRDGYTLQKDPQKKASQLYVTGVVVEGTTVHTYPSIYLWNQTTNTSNHTPAWDVFKIPPAPVPL